MDINLRAIGKAISQGKCLVILGPHLLDKSESSVNDQLNSFLEIELNDPEYYYSKDGFFGFGSTDREFAISSLMEEFYEKLEPNEAYENISKIPFSLIINTAPDKTLNKAFEKEGRPFDFDYYNMIDPSKTTQNSNPTLIYNLYGDYTDIDSMVLTFQDFFKYLESIISNEGEMKIMTKIKKAKAVIFFGFSFDKWNFQLLLSMMQLNAGMKSSGEIPEDAVMKNFYVEEFKIKFLDDSAQSIIKKLVQATIEDEITPPTNKKIELFISYAWKGESENMANLLEKALEENQIHLIRDKNVLEYKGSIIDFMKRIGKGDGVIVVLSDKYLKSSYCMFELIEIYDNDNFKDRIFPIVLGDANIFEGEGILAYKEYWKSEMDKKNELVKGLGMDAADSLREEYKLCEKIHGYMDKMGRILKDMNSLSPEIHRDTNFEKLMKAIKTPS